MKKNVSMQGRVKRMGSDTQRNSTQWISSFICQISYEAVIRNSNKLLWEVFVCCQNMYALNFNFSYNKTLEVYCNT